MTRFPHFLVCCFFIASMFVNTKQGVAKGIKVYGNWCGPAYGFKGPPIDAVDQVCKVHDLCVDRIRRSTKHKKNLVLLQHCRCDRLMVQQMPSAIGKVKSKKAKSRGRVMLAYMKNALCLCKKEVCRNVPKCSRVRVCKRRLGKTRCRKVLKCKKVRRCKVKTVMGRGGNCPSGSR